MKTKLKLLIYDHPIIALALAFGLFILVWTYGSQFKESWWDKPRYEATQEKTKREIDAANKESQQAQGEAKAASDEGKQFDGKVETQRQTVNRTRRRYQDLRNAPVPASSPNPDRQHLLERAKQLGIESNQ